jgi:hypothetical protein
MNPLKVKTVLAAGAFLLAVPVFAQNEGQGQGQAVVTVLPAHGNEIPANLNQQDLTVKINGKESTITNWTPLRGANDRLELVVMLDNGARSSIGTQLSEIADFIKTLPPQTKVTVAYMENGIARLGGPLTTDHDSAVKRLHLPIGAPGQDASPYFCLSNLATHWPSNDRSARREVVMISDGVDYYDPRLDLEDPYMQAAISDSVRNGLVVYSIYWENRGRFDRTRFGNASGQNLLLEVTQATGGNSYWEGIGNPVTFRPFFEDLQRRLQNQYELSFTTALKNKPEVDNLKLKVNGISGKVEAPGEVFVARSM